MEPSRSRLAQLGKNYMTDSVWGDDPRNLDSVTSRSRAGEGMGAPSPYYYGSKATLAGLEPSQSHRSTHRTGESKEKRKTKSRNVMMDAALAAMMQQEDRKREERKELLTRAAEMQSRRLSNHLRSLGERPPTRHGRI